MRSVSPQVRRGWGGVSRFLHLSPNRSPPAERERLRAITVWSSSVPEVWHYDRQSALQGTLRDLTASGYEDAALRSWARGFDWLQSAKQASGCVSEPRVAASATLGYRI
jgi:hypothetical protein